MLPQLHTSSTSRAFEMVLLKLKQELQLHTSSTSRAFEMVFSKLKQELLRQKLRQLY
jgi:hypothetical protein